MVIMSRLLLLILLGGLVVVCGISGVDGAGLPLRSPDTDDSPHGTEQDGNLEGREKRGVPCRIPPPDATGDCIVCNGEGKFQLTDDCWCDLCRPGTYMNRPCVCATDGTVTTLTDCIPAENGYMPESNWCDKPYPCTECNRDLVPIQKCGVADDTTCGPESVTDIPTMPMIGKLSLQDTSIPDISTTADGITTEGTTDINFHTSPGVTATPSKKKDTQSEDSPDDDDEEEEEEEDKHEDDGVTIIEKFWHKEWHHGICLAIIVTLVVIVAILSGAVVILVCQRISGSSPRSEAQHISTFDSNTLEKTRSTQQMQTIYCDGKVETQISSSSSRDNLLQETDRDQSIRNEPCLNEPSQGRKSQSSSTSSNKL